MQVTEYTDKWIDRLRNGGLEQGLYALKHTTEQGYDEYCCLGVGGELVPRCFTNSKDNHGNWLTRQGKHGYLDTDTAARLGLTREEQEALSKLNDKFGWTFDQIADLIEQAKTNPAALIETQQRLQYEYEKEHSYAS